MPNNQHHRFGPFRLDPVNEQVWRGEEEVILRRKTFEVLRHLVERSGQLVTKAALLDAIWPEVVVSESMPTISVGELRKALGDEAKTPQFIETVHGRGYRFIAKVTSAPEPAMKPQPLRREPPPIIVGREAELGRLQDRLKQALEGRRQIFFVAGEAGIGKTALVRAFLDCVAKVNPTVQIGRGQCVEQYGEVEPYMPVLEAITRLSRESGDERLVAILQRLAPAWLAQMPTLIDVENRARLQGQPQRATQRRMLREMAEALEATAADRPLVLLFEDLHWSDFSTLELIAAVARRSEPARLLVLATYRPVEMLTSDHPLRRMKEELELHRQCEELRLSMLGAEHVVDYLAQRFPDHGSSRFRSLAFSIHNRSEGNPLFMVNVVDFLMEAGMLGGFADASTGETVEALPADRIEVPRNIRQMIERNLEQLRPEEQALLECASVAGTEFSAAAVAVAVQREIAEIETCCTRLSRHEQFIRMEGPTSWPDGTVATCFRFRHTLYQEVLYERVSAGRRLKLHQRIAEREEAAFGDRAGEIAARLAHHFSRASNRDKAVKYLELAGQQAVRRGAAVEAEGYYRRALTLLGELPQDIERNRAELALQIGLGSVLWSSKSWSHPEAGRAFTRAQQLGEELGETSRLVTVLLGLGLSAIGRGQLKQGQDLGERLLAAAEQSQDPASICAAHTLLGQTLMWRAQFVDAEKHLNLATSYYNEADRNVLGAPATHAPGLEAISVLLRGFPDRAERLMNEAVRRSESCTDPFGVGCVHLWAGGFYVLLRDSQKALKHANALSSIAAKQPIWSGFADAYTAEALLIQGNWAEAVGYWRKASSFMKAVGYGGMAPWRKLDEAQFFASQGQIENALTLVDDVIQNTEQLPYLASPALRQRADLLALRSADALTIEAGYRAAIECARTQGARFYELQAATLFARWLRSRGRIVEARTQLAEIYDWFTEGFDTVALKEAGNLLDELLTNPKKRTRPQVRSDV